MAIRMAEAATPRTASARLSHWCSGAFMAKGATGLFLDFGGGLLQLGVEFRERRLGVHALGARLLHPVVDDRRRALLHLGEQRRVGVDDLDARLLQAFQALLVGGIPGLAVAARDVLVGQLLDRR